MSSGSGWVEVCRVEDLPETSTRGISLGTNEVILVNWFGQLFAYRNHCPHLGWPLNFETDRFFDSEQRFLQCSNHMALFEVETGHCIAGPCSGQQLETVPLQVIEGRVCLHL